MLDLNKGKTRTCRSCAKTPEHKEKLRQMLLGNKRTLGYKHSERAKALIGLYSRRPRPDISGANSPMWRGGIATENEKIRQSIQYRNWHNDVLCRDFHTCQACGKKGGNLHVDHVMPFALFPDTRFDLLNGRTLCAPCHKKTDSFGKNISYLQSIWL